MKAKNWKIGAALRLVFTDWNGDRYFQDSNGFIYDDTGYLVDDETDRNIRRELSRD